MQRLVLIVFLLGLTLTLFQWRVPEASATSITVNTTTDEINTDGDCSLREAIKAANTNLAVDACPAGQSTFADTITLANGATYLITIAGANENNNATGDFDITDNTAAVDVIINVSGAGTATIDGNDLDRVLNSNGAVEITGVAITNGNEPFDGDGAGIMAGGSLTLTNCAVTNNIGDEFAKGGGIYAQNLVMTNTVVSNNQSDEEGGGIYIWGSTFQITGSTITNNTSTQFNGGGISIETAVGTISSSTISNNHADTVAYGDGGGISIHTDSFAPTSVTLSGVTLAGNSAYDGGAIHWYSVADEAGGLAIQNSTIGAAGVGNMAVNGGAIFADGVSFDTISIDNTSIVANSATTLGGAIYTRDGLTMNITNSVIGESGVGNTAPGGGAIYNLSSTVNITQTKILYNTSTSGAVVRNLQNTVNATSITNSCLVYNTPIAFGNDVASSQNATSNWWGAATGPGPSGPGTGDKISGTIDYSGFLTSAILGCPTLPLPPTPTPTYTPTNTPTITPTYTPSNTPTITPTYTPSITPTITATSSACVPAINIPSLISPAHRAHTTDKTPTFTWGAVTGAQSYRVMIYLEDRSFEYKKRVFNVTYTLTSVETLTTNKYLWRVRAQDTVCSSWTVWSGRFTLFID